MAIQKEILEVADVLLEGRITQKEALLKTKTLMKKVRGPRDDPPPLDMILFARTRSPHKNIVLRTGGKFSARKVLKRGIPP